MDIVSSLCIDISPDKEADKMERRKALAASAALTLACLFCVSEVPSWPSNHNSQIPVTILTTAVAGKKESSFQWQMAEQAYDKLEQKMFAKVQKEGNDQKQAPVGPRPVHPKPAVILNISTHPTSVPVPIAALQKNGKDQDLAQESAADSGTESLHKMHERKKESLQATILEQRRASASGRARNMDVDMSEAKVLMAQAAACIAAEFSPAAANVTDSHNASKSVNCSAYNAAAKDHVYKHKIAFKTHTAQKRKPSHHWRAASRVSELVPRDSVPNVTSYIGLTAANTSNVSVVQGSNKTVPYIPDGFLNSSGASGYISPASLGEKGFAAFHLFIMEHDNFSVSAAHATKVPFHLVFVFSPLYTKL